MRAWWREWWWLVMLFTLLGAATWGILELATSEWAKLNTWRHFFEECLTHSSRPVAECLELAQRLYPSEEGR